MMSKAPRKGRVIDPPPQRNFPEGKISKIMSRKKRVIALRRITPSAGPLNVSTYSWSFRRSLQDSLLKTRQLLMMSAVSLHLLDEAVEDVPSAVLGADVGEHGLRRNEVQAEAVLLRPFPERVVADGDVLAP